MQRLSGALVQGLATAEAHRELDAIGVEIVVSNPRDLAAELKQESDVWGPIIKRTGVTLD